MGMEPLIRKSTGDLRGSSALWSLLARVIGMFFGSLGGRSGEIWSCNLWVWENLNGWVLELKFAGQIINFKSLNWAVKRFFWMIYYLWFIEFISLFIHLHLFIYSFIQWYIYLWISFVNFINCEYKITSNYLYYLFYLNFNISVFTCLCVSVCVSNSFCVYICVACGFSFVSICHVFFFGYVLIKR